MVILVARQTAPPKMLRLSCLSWVLDGLDDDLVFGKASDDPYSMSGVVVLLQHPKGEGDTFFLPHFF